MTGYTSIATSEWDRQTALCGYVDIDDDTVLKPLTPLIGADISGINPTQTLTEPQLELISEALLRYKVIMLRSGGAWKMNPEQHTRLCQQLSDHWGLSADTEQKKRNASRGLIVHPFLPWLKGYPHIWPTGSVTGGGQQYKLRDREEIENDEPYQANRSRQTPKPSVTGSNNGTGGNSVTGGNSMTGGNSVTGGNRSLRPGSYGISALLADSVSNGANAFHFDDGFFHQPPSAVVLNAVVLPRIGGDTIFTDMGAAYRGLDPDFQAYCRQLNQTMDWTHVFPLWEREAAQRSHQGDASLANHVQALKTAYPPSLQPLIRQHPVSGELSIYANFGFTRRINDVSETESREILALLSRMTERPEYQVRLRWAHEGDVCIYDNRITNHYAVADYGEIGPRSLHHIALLGEPTVNPSGEVIG